MAWMRQLWQHSERSVESSGGGDNGKLHHAKDVAANFTLENNGIAITQANGKRMSRWKVKKRARIRLPQRG